VAACSPEASQFDAFRLTFELLSESAGRLLAALLVGKPFAKLVFASSEAVLELGEGDLRLGPFGSDQAEG
jgi:hypothetical protein